MSLDAPARGPLERFVEEVTVDDYRLVTPSSDRTLGSWHRWRSVPVAILIGLIVAAAVITTRGNEQARQQTRAELVDRVAALSESVATRREEVTAQAATVSELQDRLLAESNDSARAAAIGTLSVQAGVTELAGPGVVVTVDDAPDAQSGSLNQVLDRDLQDIVNALWRMGATGIAVNGQRLTSDTAIRGAGEAILVNYQPLQRPYLIEALGTTTSAGEESGLQGLLDELSGDYGLVSQVSTGDVTLPAGEARAPRFARVVEEQS
jgi:uncharacterized protein YlxW (UPF0749 family)